MMDNLIIYLEQCENDTRRIINRRSASRLSNWRTYNDTDSLVDFIKRTIRVKNNQINCYLLHESNGLSLEEIVYKLCPNLFTDEDITISKKTLGIST